MSACVSVVLPAYKETFLAESLKSILDQSFTDFELIIVNDNPGSNIEAIVNRFEDARIKYFENKVNIGADRLVENWNRCIAHASGQYLVLASDDDVYNPEYLKEMVELTSKFPRCDLYYCRIRYIDENGRTLQISQPALEYETSIEFVYQRLFWRRKQALQEFFFRTSALKNCGGFVDFPLAWYSDDASLALLSKKGVAYTGKILFGMRLSGRNISTENLHRLKKLQALKTYIYWLDSFLPLLAPTNQDDEFMKIKILAEYRPILNDLRFNSIGLLPIRDSLAEYRELLNEGVYGKFTVFKQLVKKVLKLKL